MYKILLGGKLEPQIDPKNSWLLAAAEKNLPMFVPGWEDSTLGNMYSGHCISGDVKNVHTVRTGIEYMRSPRRLVYREREANGRPRLDRFLPDRGRHRG